MNRLFFASKNILDKALKCLSNPSLLCFYFKTYIAFKLRPCQIDFYLVSYPKCGKTWVTYFLENYFRLASDNCSFINRSVIRLSNETVLKFEHDKGDWVPSPFGKDKMTFDDKKYSDTSVIFLVRDPRDIMMSSYYHLTSREKIYNGNISEFIRDDLLGIEKVISFMNMWIQNKDVPKKFLMVSYEDLRKDPNATFSSILSFLGTTVDSKTLGIAVSKCSFDKMKAAQKRSSNVPWMGPGRTKNPDGMKVRKGIIGSYKDELPDDDINYLNDKIGALLDPAIGYTN